MPARAASPPPLAAAALPLLLSLLLSPLLSLSLLPLPSVGAVQHVPDALLVLRAACPAPLHHLFDEVHPGRSGPLRSLLSARSLRILSYEETCGAEWEKMVSRATLAALSAERAVLLAGWPGAAACDALAAGARALHRQQAGASACVVGEARAAAVLRLAQRLRWRRALLPPVRSAPCAAALRDITRALVGAGLDVRRSTLTPLELAWQPHVVIVCASRRVERAAAASAGPALLVVPAAEHDIHDAFKLSNISFVVSEPIYYRKNKRSNSSNDKVTAGEESPGLTSKFRRRFTLATVTSTNKEIISQQNDTEEHVRSRSTNDGREVVDDSLATGQDAAKQLISFGHGNGSDVNYESKSRVPRTSKEVYPIDAIDEFLPRQQVPYFFCKFLLIDDDFLKNPLVNEQYVIDKVTDVIESKFQAEYSRVERNKMNFHLYEWSDSPTGSWKRVAVLSTTSNRSLDPAEDWLHIVEWSNVTVSLDTWIATTSKEPDKKIGAAALAVVATCGALVTGCGLALLGRWAARRRRHRRRREDAVLSPADFTFPVDDRRRVGEGMETMLSCWLQQLHQFGGPELERPDLLKQPRAPSAPSSTCSVNRAADHHVRYKGEVVHMRYVGVGAPELRRKAADVLLEMRALRHDNLNPFIGWLGEARALVWARGARGSLQDVLAADAVALDWTFRLSLLTDVVRAMRYLHASPLRAHGRLSSRNCVVDSRWVLRLTDYGLPALHAAQALPPPPRTASDLLWTAPELLRERALSGEVGATQPGDVFSFAIVMQEVIVRGEPYCMLALTPDEIVEKLSRPPPLIRPSVSLGAAPPEAVSVMRQCWSEAPELRPDFARLNDVFRQLHKGRKVNIVDSMFEMLEKYSNNLEELIRERTEQLDMEKKKTEQLLNRMLPRSVAERLVLGVRVEPEEFEEVSIYFSDIVGFTELAARSTPVQVAELLNELYTRFDAAIEQHRVYKVETIGDAYMVAGGLPERARDHAPSLATCALHLLHEAGRARVRHQPGAPLLLRAGLHSGPCAAAVVGRTMPRYCLFGDTVNTAARMESTGAAWRIQVSAATAALLHAAGGYQLRPRGLTHVKGKGTMHTYWLLGKDGFDKPLPTPPPLEGEDDLLEMDDETEPRATSPRVPSDDAPNGEHQDCGSRSPSDLHAEYERRPPSAHDGSPRLPRPTRALSAAGVELHARYRYLGGARRAVRRQWSLERGEGAHGAGAAGCASAPPSPPSALGAGAPPPRPATRYRTRPHVPAEARAP